MLTQNSYRQSQAPEPAQHITAPVVFKNPIHVGRALSILSRLPLTFAQAKTIPLMNPRAMADTLPRVTGSPKKISPLTAMGSLFNAPTIEYVVEDVMRIHHAVANDMKIVARPEYSIAEIC